MCNSPQEYNVMHHYYYKILHGCSSYSAASCFVNPDKIQNARSRLDDYSSNYSVLAIYLTFHRVSVMCVGKHDLILPALPAGILGGLLLVHVFFSYSLDIWTACKNNLSQTNRDVFFIKNMFQCLLF